ncbi:hypothetical protein [Dactylosporangium salmoneum]|uniref:hypothetical protein n=1 Tax=Dactylosporangium salmoneum TaxID=53361 RepID=UPI0031DB5C51
MLIKSQLSVLVLAVVLMFMIYWLARSGARVSGGWQRRRASLQLGQNVRALIVAADRGWPGRLTAEFLESATFLYGVARLSG